MRWAPHGSLLPVHFWIKSRCFESFGVARFVPRKNLSGGPGARRDRSPRNGGWTNQFVESSPDPRGNRESSRRFRTPPSCPLVVERRRKLTRNLPHRLQRLEVRAKEIVAARPEPHTICFIDIDMRW